MSAPTPVLVSVPLIARVLEAPDGVTVVEDPVMAELQSFSVGETFRATTEDPDRSTITLAPLVGTLAGAQLLVLLHRSLVPPRVQVDWAKDEAWSTKNRPAGSTAVTVHAEILGGMNFISVGCLGIGAEGNLAGRCNRRGAKTR
jgi:hypothetical protein